ncbi:alcohol dehydrogenase catalytic domain-containing protein [Thermomonospora umbrina]|uniref:Propanol-preferring alcohol dehydrogenase n=1 Tax=Thermomonospora umbrina TaxID=111806 RepID=A0A3D9SNX6_9ACTN|nr:alcohol dehydrogenase catalytic domain-containing protein [Thermomonospora umbrina]REE95663.1 propanol-preferring alcohol dehydrogenase [Thermomonospora umbrina]
MNLMLAARAYEGSDELRLEKLPVPEPGPQDVVIKVASAGLAPGMMRLKARGAFKHLPTTPGHEVAGTVTAVGDEADATLLGRLVRFDSVLSCRECRYCRTDREQMCAESAMIGHAAFGTGSLELYARYHDGGLAEYVRVPSWLVDVLPDGVSADVGAKVHDFGNAVRALRNAEVPEGGTLVITAATGTMGTASIKLAPFYGAGRLILVGRSAERLEALRPLAGDLPVETVALDDLDDGWESDGGLTRRLRELVPAGPDAVVDYLPQGPGTGQAMGSMATGATLVHMGGNGTPLPFDVRTMMHRCWRFVGTRSCTRGDTNAVLDLLGSGRLRVDELITHRFALTDVNDALAAMEDRTEPMWMTVVRPEGEES